jgi:HlyD family secretion protein
MKAAIVRAIMKPMPLVFAECVVLALFVLFCRPGNTGKNAYQLSQLNRGDLKVTVSSTGTLAAEDTVEVGSEVSGTVKEIFADFNDNVKKGQVLARLKPDLLESSVHDAGASLAKARAQSEEALINYNQNKTLYEKGFLSEKEFLPYKTANETATAELQSAQAALDRAKTNLEYATIRSPIDGVILERAIEVGQTVAASFSTPKMFIIAKDLSKMKIKALVDETDISQIKPNQEVTFTVSAYPEKTFTGKVSQIRRQSTTVSNVVNYTVLVDAANDENLLFPGMTTTIEFIVNQAKDVFLVPSDALKFQPQPDRKHGSKPRGPPPGNPGKNMDDNMPPQPPQDSFRADSANNDAGILWSLDEKGDLKPIRVKTGLSDESNTAVYGEQLKEGMNIITGYATGAAKKSAASSMPRPPGFF